MNRHLVFFEKEEDIFASDNSAVLLMEDDEMTKEITTEMLKYLGYTVEAVAEGEEAVALYKLRKEEGSPFKAVILDICQPEGLDGEETLRQLLEYDPDVKAVASSGFIGNKTRIDPGVNGFHAPLPKPYGIRQLGSVLRSVIGLNRRLGDRDARRVKVFTGSAIILTIGWFTVPWINAFL